MDIYKIQDGKLYVSHDVKVYDLVTPKDALNIIARLREKGYRLSAVYKKIGVTPQTVCAWRKDSSEKLELSARLQAALRTLEQEEL